MTFGTLVCVGSVYTTASAEAGCGERQYEVVAADDVKVENKEPVDPVENWFFVPQPAPSAQLCRQFVPARFQPLALRTVFVVPRAFARTLVYIQSERPADRKAQKGTAIFDTVLAVFGVPVAAV